MGMIIIDALTKRITRGGPWVALGAGWSGAVPAPSSIVVTQDPTATWAPSVPSQNGIYSINHGSDGYWVCGGNYSRIFVTTGNPGLTWTQVTISPYIGATNLNFWGMQYGNGKWVAIARYSPGGSKMATATNPSGVWTLNLAYSGGISSSAYSYGNGIWVGGGSGGKIYTAIDPSGAWTLNTTYPVGTSPDITKIKYLNGFWVATTSDGRILYTTNPAGSWTVVAAPLSLALYGLTYGNGMWVVMSAYKFMYSTNLINWTLSPIFMLDSQRELEYGNGYFVAGGLYGYMGYTNDVTSNSWVRIPHTQSQLGDGGTIHAIKFG